MERPDLAQRNREAVFLNAQTHVGEKVFSKTYQMYMTIIAWKGTLDIDVQFEDGTIVTNQHYSSFKSKNIKYPNFFKKQKVGLIKTMKCGMNATIIDYENSNNITVQFEDGTIRENVSLRAFNSGALSNPNIANRKQRIGLSKEQVKGFVATIVEYKSSQEIIVQFEDGKRKKTCWDTFNKGKVAHPKIESNKNLKNEIIGKVYRTNCGLKATVIEFNTTRSLKIKFEDGKTKKIQFKRLEEGHVGHPNLKINRESRFLGFKCKCVYVSKDNTYYKVKHKDGFEGIMTPQEMIAYNK